MNNYLTTRQAANRLAMTEETVRRMCRDGRLPHTRLPNRTLRIPAAAVNDLLPDSTLSEINPDEQHQHQ
jgi:excisionase family DNA binding protein